MAGKKFFRKNPRLSIQQTLSNHQANQSRESIPQTEDYQQKVVAVSGILFYGDPGGLLNIWPYRQMSLQWNSREAGSIVMGTFSSTSGLRCHD